MPAHYAASGIEFSTLEKAIRAGGKGTGLAIADRNLIADELADGCLAQLTSSSALFMNAGNCSRISLIVLAARCLFFDLL